MSVTALSLRDQKRTLFAVCVLLLVSPVLSCHEPAELRPAKRPPGVPETATWAGGADGGSYMHCAVDLKHDVNECRVWNDYTGQLMESGSYRLVRERRAAKQSELRFTGADWGGHIWLENGLTLQHQ